ncbi:MAG: hypothetical protein WEB00_10590 [Dehalococcoidia bacterium]
MARKQDRQQRAKTAFEFFKARALAGGKFGVDELGTATGWKPRTAKTHIDKHWKELIRDEGGGIYTVLQEILGIGEDDFLEVARQRQFVFRRYERHTYSAYAQYELLLPLTQEAKLRAALDDLFYTDSLRQRISEIGLPNIAKEIPRHHSETDDAYINRLLDFIGERFGGYSIGQVSGRYRAGDLLARNEAAELLLKHRRYLVDETTAVVRFIVKATGSRINHGRDFNPSAQGLASLPFAGPRELEEVRFLFFRLFLEAVVRTVNEEEVWLIEEYGTQRFLHVLRQVY